MPRSPRLDAVGVLHHVIVRGIERGRIFRGRRDKEDLLERIGALVEREALVVYAWALMTNHVHLLVRTGKLPLSRSMRSLLSGYATQFNRRHRRSGQLFQNRFKSIVCEEEAYFLELLRYIHLNPVRAGMVKSLAELDEYAFTGHAVVLGRASRSWQEVDEVLGRFGGRRRDARRGYQRFLAEGLGLEEPDLSGGGLVRSVGGWEAVTNLRRGREEYQSDERILGSSEFVDRILAEANSDADFRDDIDLDEVMEAIARAAGLQPEILASKSAVRSISAARSELSWVWTQVLGRSGRGLATRLGLGAATIHHGARRHEASGKGLSKEVEALLRREPGPKRSVRESSSSYVVGRRREPTIGQLRALIGEICRSRGITQASLLRGDQSRAVSGARREVCRCWVYEIGGSVRRAAAVLGVATATVSQASRKPA